MNKISIYVLLILTFLGLSKSLVTSKQGRIYVINENVLPSLFKGAPLTVILIGQREAGFIIKTYLHTYQVIHGFKQPEILVVRTSPKFWKKNRDNIGMSLLRRGEREDTESTIPMPPGFLYIGDPAFGHWAYDKSGKRVWFFHRAYKYFPQAFGWPNFNPDFQFYKAGLIYQKQGRAFHGLNNEFGTNGIITKQTFASHLKEKKLNKISLHRFFMHLLKLPWQHDIKGKKDDRTL